MSEPLDDAAVLARLQGDRQAMDAERRALSDQIEKLDAVIAIYKERLQFSLPIVLPPPPPPPLAPELDELVDAPLRSLILATLRKAGRPQTTNEVIRILERLGRGGSENFYNTVYTTLKRMQVSGEVDRDEGGSWRVLEQP